jgi:hypothetical protein
VGQSVYCSKHGGPQAKYKNNGNGKNEKVTLLIRKELLRTNIGV